MNMNPFTLRKCLLGILELIRIRQIDLACYLGVSRSAAKYFVGRLIDLGYLQQVSPRNYEFTAYGKAEAEALSSTIQTLGKAIASAFPVGASKADKIAEALLLGEEEAYPFR